jgi:nephrocystin-3
MHAERDYLVRMVFPELRERMAKRRLYLVDIDLRWGITEEEAEHGKVLEVCLDEVERCRPFFIGILGERYGSVPTKVPEDTEFTHPWLVEHKDHSLTALEIIHGVLRNPDLAQRSFFYFRDSRFIPQIPETKRADYMAENPEAGRKLIALKEKIRASGRPVMENYPCQWDDKQGHLVELETFGQRVLEDLWTAICAAHPQEAPEADPLAIEREMHEAFTEERSRLHVGRVEQARRLTEYVQGIDRQPAVITGESGCGKSAFLASWYRRYASEHPDDFVLAYFIGASPDSTNHFRLLRNICQELKRQFALKEEIPEDDKKLSETMAILLTVASQGKSRIVIVLDALDQLLPLEAAHGLGWLLDYIPEKVRLVMSSLEGDCLDVLRRRQAEEIPLPPLPVAEQRQIVQVLLGEWRRKLDERQMASLLSHPGVKNPLYLRIALEELRLFGKFEELPTRIKTLADDIPGMFSQVLERLEGDHGKELVTEAFSLLGCSRYGLSETELLELLRREGEEQYPRALWARLTRSTRMYLVQRGELISFLHRQLAETVAARYPEHKKRHVKLAAYFEKAPVERKLDEYPYQLEHAEEWNTLADALSDLDFFSYAWERDRRYEWMGYWRSLEGRFEPGKCYQVAMETKEKAEGETESISRLLSIIGWFLDDMGLYPSALPFKERALAIDERTLGSNHPQVANSLNSLAMLYDNQIKYDEALPLFQRALSIRERALGPNHPDVARSLNNLAALYYERVEYDEALPLFQRALSIRERALGPNHPDVARNLNNLAVLYDSGGKYDESLPLYQRALAIWERTLGPNHPEVAASLNNLATIYYEQGKYKEALPLFKRALSIVEAALGPDHPDSKLYRRGQEGCEEEMGKR